jgi:hypothetical protein
MTASLTGQPTATSILFRTAAMTPETIRSGDSSMNKDAASADGRLKKWLSGFVKNSF